MSRRAVLLSIVPNAAPGNEVAQRFCTTVPCGDRADADSPRGFSAPPCGVAGCRCTSGVTVPSEPGVCRGCGHGLMYHVVLGGTGQKRRHGAVAGGGSRQESSDATLSEEFSRLVGVVADLEQRASLKLASAAHTGNREKRQEALRYLVTALDELSSWRTRHSAAECAARGIPDVMPRMRELVAHCEAIRKSLQDGAKDSDAGPASRTSSAASPSSLATVNNSRSVSTLSIAAPAAAPLTDIRQRSSSSALHATAAAAMCLPLAHHQSDDDDEIIGMARPVDLDTVAASAAAEKNNGNCPLCGEFVSGAMATAFFCHACGAPLTH